MEQGWTRHEDAEGFALDVPEGWRAKGEGGRVVADGPDGERVTILPLQIEAHFDAGRARDVMLTLAGQLWPRQRWAMPARGWQFSENGVRAVGTNEHPLRELVALWWANTPRGATVFFYGLAARPARFESLGPVFARILGSFGVTGVGGPADPLAGVQFARWTDPMETAFSCEIPAGWRASGGTFRRPLFPLTELVIHSPDGRVMIRLGDVNYPSKFCAPNPTLLGLGRGEGQFTSDGTLILSFQPGVQFAANYVQQTMGRSFPLRWLEQRERADYVQALAWYAQARGFVAHTAGEVTYTFEANRETCAGYAFAETAVTHFSDLATLWNLQTLNCLVAPLAQVKLAEAVFSHAVATAQTNPHWLLAEMKMNQQVAHDFQRYREYSNNLWQQTQQARMASWDRISEQRGDILSGQVRVVDPHTGQAYKVHAGSSYYWIDSPRGVIAGTNTPYKPTWDFREMIQTYD